MQNYVLQPWGGGGIWSLSPSRNLTPGGLAPADVLQGGGSYGYQHKIIFGREIQSGHKPSQRDRGHCNEQWQ